MITPSKIKERAQRLYFSFLEADLKGGKFFPRVVPSDKGKISDSYQSRAQGLRLLKENSKENKGYGYRVEFKEVQSRAEGVQSLPSAIWIDTAEDYLRLIDKKQEYLFLINDLAVIKQLVPQLESWSLLHPKKVIQYQGKWGHLAKVCQYFLQNPLPNLYVRQLPIAVHTKFIERHFGVLGELLDFLLPAEFINQFEAESFEKRFSLRFDESLVRFRILDKNLAQNQFSGFEDLSIPISAFELQGKGIKQVFIAENKMNILTFPPIHNSIIIFGSGFKIQQLKEVQWMRNQEIEIFYWGDLDIAGFQIFSLLKSFLPRTKSLLMDLKTWNQFNEYAEFVSNFKAPTYLPFLNDEQNSVYQKLLNSTTANRLEQEKIPHWWVEEYLRLFFNY